MGSSNCSIWHPQSIRTGRNLYIWSALRTLCYLSILWPLLPTQYVRHDDSDIRHLCGILLLSFSSRPHHDCIVSYVNSSLACLASSIFREKSPDLENWSVCMEELSSNVAHTYRKADFEKTWAPLGSTWRGHRQREKHPCTLYATFFV